MIQELLDHSFFENLKHSEASNLQIQSVQQETLGESLDDCTRRNVWFNSQYNQSILPNHGHEKPSCDISYPAPTISGTFKAFASVMFAFAGASTFPTIQADMKQKEKFNMAAYIACISKYNIPENYICKNKLIFK